MQALTQREDVQASVAPRAGPPVPVAIPALASTLGNRATARLVARSPQRLPGGRAMSPESALLARVPAAGEGTKRVGSRCACGGVVLPGGECTKCLARRLESEGMPAGEIRRTVVAGQVAPELAPDRPVGVMRSATPSAGPAELAGRGRSHHDDLDGEAKGGRLLREAVPARAGQRLVQRIGLKDIPLIGKTAWCQWEMGHMYALRAECMKEFKEVCSGDMLDPACTNFCRTPLLKRDERAWWERWFGLAPDPNRVVPMGEPGSSGDISGCILDCMKSKEPEAMGTFLEVCSGNAASAMGD